MGDSAREGGHLGADGGLLAHHSRFRRPLLRASGAGDDIRRQSGPIPQRFPSQPHPVARQPWPRALRIRCSWCCRAAALHEVVIAPAPAPAAVSILKASCPNLLSSRRRRRASCRRGHSGRRRWPSPRRGDRRRGAASGRYARRNGRPGVQRDGDHRIGSGRMSLGGGLSAGTLSYLIRNLHPHPLHHSSMSPRIPLSLRN